MFCIAAFIVFFILAIFSASYRPLAAKAWHCVLRRVSFRPCDIDFSAEMKSKIVGKVMIHSPRLARFVRRWIDWFAFAFVILSIWSLVYSANSGLNLWVYGTCDLTKFESCSLGGEACVAGTDAPGIIESIQTGKLLEWVTGPFVRFGQAVARIPDTLRTWKAENYVGSTATFRGAIDTAAPIALEVMDPLCQFCRKLFVNIEDAGLLSSYRMTYLLYPIPDAQSNTGYKFPHSFLVASYIEAAKHVQQGTFEASHQGDWELLQMIWSTREDGTDWQTYLRMGATREDVIRTLEGFLRTIGYTPKQVEEVRTLAASQEVVDALKSQRAIVEHQLRTIKIPTFLIARKRYDRVVDSETLKKFVQQ